ncbi:MAG: phage portal protein [Ruminococcaceae bacterium]|nr:phage portal protein [Oscillospiraceae bacterium]
MAIGKRKKLRPESEVVAVPQISASSHPFINLSSYNPMSGYDMALYKSLREAVPVIDAAIYKIIRLIGSFSIITDDDEAGLLVKDFLKAVNVGGTRQGIDAFVSTFLEQLLTYGTSVGEIITDGNTITHLYNADLKSVSLSQGNSALDIIVNTDNGNGTFVPVKYPALILLSVHNPEPGSVYGTSILKGLPFISDVLLKIFNTIGTNWERVGNVRFAVTYKPQNDTMDKAYAKERAMLVANEWSKTMSSGSSSAKDFVAVGDVSIKAIGADNQILDSEIPVRQMLEQIVAKLGIPPFLLGLSWSTTERMSFQQADILTSEIEFYRRELNPVISQIIRLFLRLHGFDCRFEIEWDDITLQDITELARSRYYDAQTAKILNETGGEQSDDSDAQQHT